MVNICGGSCWGTGGGGCCLPRAGGCMGGAPWGPPGGGWSWMDRFSIMSCSRRERWWW